MKEPTSVGLGEYAISRNPEDVLVAYGLGSCLGVSMIDPVNRIAGLLHAVLPEPSNGTTRLDANPYKYVDSGIEALLAGLIQEGARPGRIVVRMAGGANMLLAADMTRSFDIGTRNIVTARATLQRLRLSLSAEAVGGHTGRTVRVYVAENRVTVKVIGDKEQAL